MNIEIFISIAAVVCPLAMGAAGWLLAELRTIRKDTAADNTKLWQHLNTVEKKLLEHYVRREDFRAAVDDVKAAMKEFANEIKLDIKELEKQLNLFREGN